MTVVQTDAELAAALGVTTRSVFRWKNRGLPRLPDGGYDVDAVRAWRADVNDRAMRNRGQALPSPPPTSANGNGTAPAPTTIAEKTLQRKRLAEAELASTKAEVAALDLKVKTGDLIEAAEHVRIFRELIFLLRRRFDSLTQTVPTALGAKPSVAVQKKRWRREFDLLLDDLHAAAER